ncbi:MAG TPA: GcrA family cell cycle regulator [Alphaproteobacteria bacterium]|nr:GcrA family cell cycle regulator [Alphaproteobacteria bacterium]
MPKRSPSPSGWTVGRVEVLERLWREGASASQVARVLGCSRNAVIGKVHRLGLSKDGRHAAARPRNAPPKPSAGRMASRRTPPQGTAAGRPVEAMALRAEILPGLVMRLERLGPRACRWPIGDPQQEGFAFCGRQADGGAYCAAHASLAHPRRRQAAG